MKILSIGNSFSVDSQRWVIDIARAGGVQVTLGDLYIGGCSLERHCENMKSGLPAYDYYFNNKNFGATSLQTGLKDEDWDIITLQQASHFSGISETYHPFIEDLYEYVSKTVPKAKIFINETWAYEFNSTHHAFPTYESNRYIMHERLSEAYKAAAKDLGVDIIPIGDAVALARENKMFDPERGGIALTRDGFHLSYSCGRYLAGLIWCKKLLGMNISDNPFRPADYEYIGKNQNGEAQYREIEGTRMSETYAQALKQVANTIA